MSEKAPGFEDYTPSRLDWIAFVLNSILPSLLLARDGCELLFLPHDDGKSLALKIRYYKSNIDEKRLDQLVDTTKGLALSFAKKYEWDSWFEVEVILEAVEHESDKEKKNNS